MNYVSFYQNRLLGYDFLQNIFYERPFKGVTKPTYKVGILIDSAFKFPPLTGITYRLYQLSNVLINHGHEVCWFICNRNFKSIEEIQSLGSSQIKIHLIPEDYFYDLTYMSAILLHEKIDILQYEISQTFFSIGMELKRRTNIPCVLENHDIEFDLQRTLDGSSDTDLLKFTQGLACQVADAVVCMTQTDQQLLINELRIDPRKIILAPNGIQTTYESPKFEDKDDILVFLGNFFYKPNLESLEFFMDQVFPDLVVACPNVHVRALGMMPEETRQKYNLVKNFVATGPLTEEQLLTELNHAKVGMCTVLSGSGMKVKI
ncbi:MAG TPA: glycosyltransferase, partial [Candidatus Nitrosotenuis sp.]|nr:glycosyltransferase [Candidatus Nitrosotenuis sp.]